MVEKHCYPLLHPFQVLTRLIVTPWLLGFSSPLDKLLQLPYIPEDVGNFLHGLYMFSSLGLGMTFWSEDKWHHPMKNRHCFHFS